MHVFGAAVRSTCKRPLLLVSVGGFAKELRESRALEAPDHKPVRAITTDERILRKLVIIFVGLTYDDARPDRMRAPRSSSGLEKSAKNSFRWGTAYFGELARAPSTYPTSVLTTPATLPKTYGCEHTAQSRIELAT